MAWTKAKTIIAAGVIVLLAAGATTTVTLTEIQKHTMNAWYSWEVPEASFGVFYRMPPQIKVVPTKFSQDGHWCSDGSRGAMGIAQSVKGMIQAAFLEYDVRTVVETELPTNKYDFFAKQRKGERPESWMAEFQREITRETGFKGDLEMRNANVLLLKPCDTGVINFKVSHRMPHGGLAFKQRPGTFSAYAQPIDTLTSTLEHNFQIPVVDQTGLKQTYDYSLAWDESDPKQPNLDGLKKALASQLGLELVPTNMPVKMLVIEKAE